MLAAPPAAAEAAPSGLSRPPLSPTPPVSQNPQVAETWREFDEVDDYAARNDLEPPAAATKRAARKILSALLREFPRYYAVMPGDERDISFQTSAGMGKGRGVLIVCDDEDIACYVTLSGENTMRHYDYAQVDSLPDDFIRDAIRALE